MDDSFVKIPSPKTHEYLYGVDVCYFINFNYIEAIKKKIELAKKNYEVVENSTYKNTDRFLGEQLKQQRLMDIFEAIKHNEALLREYYEKCSN